MILGAVILVIVCAGSFIMKQCPAGFIPEGYIPPVQTVARPTVDKTPVEMLKTPIFYVMIVMLTCGGTFGLMIISSAKGLALALTPVSAATATLFVSVLCLFNTAGRLVAGTLSDKLGRINTLTFALVIALIGLVCLYICEDNGSAAIFAAGVMLIGICFGTFMGVFPGFCTDQFGTKNNTVNYGIMWIGFSAAGIVGPSILTNVFNSTGSYQGAFIIAFAMAAFGLALSCVYRIMVRK
jgi:MFS family permease